MLRRVWSGWKGPLILVTPRTVVGWHRADSACGMVNKVYDGLLNGK
jgi:hypothetical protein